MVKSKYLKNLDDYQQKAKKIFHGIFAYASDQPMDKAKALKILESHIPERTKRVEEDIVTIGIDKKPGTILSVGCGLGAHEFAYAEKGYDVVGLEYVLHSLEAATEYKNINNTEKIAFVNADSCTLPFKDHSFDYVVSYAVIEHVCDLKALHAEILRVLRPGGVYYAATQNYWGILSPVKHIADSQRGVLPGEIQEDGFFRRMTVLMHLIKKLFYGIFLKTYTQDIPFDRFKFGKDHKMIPEYFHHLDPYDLHAINHYEMKRILETTGFVNIKNISFNSKKSLFHKAFTLFCSIPVIKYFGPNFEILGEKQK